MRQAFPRATRQSLYTFVNADPERRLVGPALTLAAGALVAMAIVGWL
jgi:hypothetical protein